MNAGIDRTGMDRPVAPALLPGRLVGLNALVVDDSGLQRRVAHAALSGQGADVQVAESGGVAVEKAASADPPFDVILMDIQMPGLDGHQATRRIRRLPGGRLTPIIALTADASAAGHAACIAAGMNACLAKPIELETFLSTILEHWRRPAGMRVGADADALPGAPPARALDLEGALERMGWNRALFREIARRFLQESGPMMAALHASLGSGTRFEALAMLHKMKGLSATLGNAPLAGLIVHLEAELKAQRRLDDADIGLLRSLLTAGNQALAMWVAAFEAVANPAAAPEGARGRTAIRHELDGLRVLLAGSNMRAVDACAALRRRLGAAFADRLLPLSQAVGQLDFGAAQRELVLLQATLK